MYRDRDDAGRQLARELKGCSLHSALVLGIPRGGIVVGHALACELGAELDVVLSRKLRSPRQPELAVGALSEDGHVHLNEYGEALAEEDPARLKQEIQFQRDEIARRKELFRRVHRQAPVEGRSVIVTDDGLATGATMIAALETIRPRQPRDLLVAVPVAVPDRLEEIRPRCDGIVCLLQPDDFLAIGQFYEDFSQTSDDQVVNLLVDNSKRMALANRSVIS